MRAASVSDFRELARRRLPHMFFEYIDGGSYAEATLGRNVSDFEAMALRQRVMKDMSALDMSVQTLGQTLKMPVGLAPVGMAGMYASRGEVQAGRPQKPGPRSASPPWASAASKRWPRVRASPPGSSSIC